jgi:putative transport protein
MKGFPMHDILDVFRHHPELAIFLSLAIGYLLGKIKVGAFSLGATTGTLIAALTIGQAGIEVTPLIKQVFFALFIFTIGYRVGPQFFASLKGSAKILALSVVFCVIALVVAILAAKGFGLDPGSAGGLVAGALTQSAVIGTTDGALQGLGLPAAKIKALQDNVAITYAVTYVIGTLFVVIFIKSVLPKLMGADLKQACRQYEDRLGIAGELPAGLFKGYQPFGMRAYRVNQPGAVDQTVEKAESRFPDSVSVEQVKRDDRILEAKPGLTILEGDILALAGPRRDLVTAEKIIGEEVDDPATLNIEGESLDIWVTNKELSGKTLAEIGTTYGHGVFLKKICRQGHDLPRQQKTVLKRGDTLHVVGSKKDVERFAAVMGYPERPTIQTDLIFLGVGVILGTLVGLISVTAAGIPLSLGAGGGILLAGLVFGWLRSVHPTFGAIPGPSQWIMQDLGLNLFIAVVGIGAGPKAIEALATAGVAVVGAGMVVALAPHILTTLVARFFLKMNVVEVAGVLCGAGTITAALNAVRDETDSAAPALAYTPAYAVGNVLLTIWGPVIVAVMA